MIKLIRKRSANAKMIFKDIIVKAIDDPRYHLAENPEVFEKGLSEYSL